MIINYSSNWLVGQGRITTPSAVVDGSRVMVYFDARGRLVPVGADTVQDVLRAQLTNRGPILPTAATAWSAYAHQATGEITADIAGTFSQLSLFLVATKTAAAPDLTVALQGAPTSAFTNKFPCPFKSNLAAEALSLTINATTTTVLRLPSDLVVPTNLRLSITSAATTDGTNYYTISAFWIGTNK